MRPRPISSSDKNKLATVLLSLVTALAGVVLGQGLDLWKTRALRAEDARVKARELAWTQASDAFQRLFGLNVKLRADINRFRLAEIDYAFHKALAERTTDLREMQIADHYQQVADDFTSRVIEDRTQLQGLLGWVQFMLPIEDQTLHRASLDLINLSAWYPPVPPPTSVMDLDTWRLQQIQQATAGARQELDTKFATLLERLYTKRTEILSAAARNYVNLVE